MMIILVLCVVPAQADSLNDPVEMALIPEGWFVKGLAEGDAGSKMNPEERIYLDAFLIDLIEVTNARYKKCVRAGACTLPSLIIDYPPAFHEQGKDWYFEPEKADYPVVGLTWKQAVQYCRWTGKRLPLSSEWEKAARGTDGRKFPWGNKWDERRANWDDRGKTDGYERIAPAGSFPRGVSPYGVYDMAGNVREWVDEAILKGGSWYSDPSTLRSGDPGHEYLVERDDDMGFRCAADAEHIARFPVKYSVMETTATSSAPSHEKITEDPQAQPFRAEVLSHGPVAAPLYEHKEDAGDKTLELYQIKNFRHEFPSVSPQ